MHEHVVPATLARRRLVLGSPFSLDCSYATGISARSTLPRRRVCTPGMLRIKLTICAPSPACVASASTSSWPTLHPQGTVSSIRGRTPPRSRSSQTSDVSQIKPADCNLNRTHSPTPFDWFMLTRHPSMRVESSPRCPDACAVCNPDGPQSHHLDSSSLPSTRV